MPLILAVASNRNDGSMDVLIILGPDNIERIKEKDPVELKWWEYPFAKQRPATIGISYANETEMMQITQLARQGKTAEAIYMATSGFKYRPEKGDHDLGPERFQ